MDELREKDITELAKRIYEYIDPWDREPDKTEEEHINDIFNQINVNPEDTIRFLLDLLDNYSA
jgi:hypothetical protein